MDKQSLVDQLACGNVVTLVSWRLLTQEERNECVEEFKQKGWELCMKTEFGAIIGLYLDPMHTMKREKKRIRYDRTSEELSLWDF